jgi:arsenite-transporting ATPase
LSDAFGQKFSKSPEPVTGVENLFAMEIDPADDDEEDEGDMLGGNSEEKKMFQGLAGAMPGMDEAASFGKVMKLVQSMEFDVVVFDTAPTGHTLRFLQFPQMLTNTFGSLFSGSMGGIFSQMMSMMGGSEEANQGRLSHTQSVIAEISKQFQDPVLTTFIAVTIPEFLPLYETERLLQELAKFNMDARNIVINQVLDPTEAQSCQHCKAKSAIQQTYLRQADELYEGLFHISVLPAVTEEVRGVDSLQSFSERLLTDNVEKLKVSGE